jgi:tetratricopeptide (TPR) repeat protein
VIGPMQGLRTLYGHTGRRVEWARLVEELVPDLVDPATEGPRPGREDQWGMITSYRTQLARKQRDYATADRLLRARLIWDRERAAAALAMPPEQLDADQRNRIRNLGGSMHELGELLREQQQPACVDAYHEARELVRRIGDRPAEAIAAYNLGRAYGEVPGLQDLDEAESWYQHSLDLRDESDHFGRAQCIGQLGQVHRKRFIEARAAGRPEEEVLAHLNAAGRAYHQALDLCPADAINELAVSHTQLGNTYADANQPDRALRHWQEAIHQFETAGNRYTAAQTRDNVALALFRRGRFGDALVWAQAALRNYQAYGDHAAANIVQTQQLIARIEQAMAGDGA